MANAAINVTLVGYGQQVDLDPLPLGSSVEWAFTCEDADARTVIDVTGWSFRFGLAQLDLFGNPQLPAVDFIPTVVSGPAGTVAMTWDPEDTGEMPPGRYAFDLWGSDAGGGRRRLLWGFILFEATPTPMPPAP